MDKVLGLQYKFTNGKVKHSQMFQSTSDKYGDAVNQLIEHVTKTFDTGGELEIERIIIFKTVKR